MQCTTLRILLTRRRKAGTILQFTQARVAATWDRCENSYILDGIDRMKRAQEIPQFRIAAQPSAPVIKQVVDQDHVRRSPLDVFNQARSFGGDVGGPIINPDVEAFCITPLCPHSLSFRPVVVSSKSTVVIVAARVNDGTTLFCDGQASTPLVAGERVIIRRNRADVLLVENPREREWRTLAAKLNWATGPRYNHESEVQGAE